MPKLIVYYPRHDGCEFDRDYYEVNHVKLVQDAWEPVGMTGKEVFWPHDDAQPFACMIALSFTDNAAIDAALSSAATPGVMADVAKFTDIKPGIYRTE